MHPELMHLAAQARYDDLRREATVQRRSAKYRLRFWRRPAPGAQPVPAPLAPVVPAVTSAPLVPAQVRRVPQLVQEELSAPFVQPEQIT